MVVFFVIFDVAKIKQVFCFSKSFSKKYLNGHHVKLPKSIVEYFFQNEVCWKRPPTKGVESVHWKCPLKVSIAKFIII